MLLASSFLNTNIAYLAYAWEKSAFNREQKALNRLLSIYKWMIKVGPRTTHEPLVIETLRTIERYIPSGRTVELLPQTPSAYHFLTQGDECNSEFKAVLNQSVYHKRIFLAPQSTTDILRELGRDWRTLLHPLEDPDEYSRLFSEGAEAGFDLFREAFCGYADLPRLPWKYTGDRRAISNSTDPDAQQYDTSPPATIEL